MRSWSILSAFLLLCSICSAENIIVSAATPDKKLILLNVEYLNNKYRVVDQAIFNLPFQVANTALARLQNGNYQVVWTAQDASGKIKLNSMIFDADLNKVGNIKKFGTVLSSHFNLNILDPSQEGLNQAILNKPSTDESLFSSSGGLPEFVYITGRNEITGAPLSIRRKLFSQSPPGFRPNIAVYTCPSDQQENERCYYSILGYDNTLQRNGVFFGNVDEQRYTSAFLFTTDVRTGALCGKQGTDNFYFIHGEYGDSSFRLKTREFQGLTGQPAGNLRPLTGIYRCDRSSPFPSYAAYGTLIVSEGTGGCHAIFTRPNPENEYTTMAAFRLSSKGLRASDVQPLNANIVDAFFYALNSYPNR